MAERQTEICNPDSGDARLARETGYPSGEREKFSGKEAFENMAAKTGIVFFQDYWRPNGQGDHIDLWNGSRLTEGTSWIRIQAGINIPGVWSDYAKAKSVWFWAVA